MEEGVEKLLGSSLSLIKWRLRPSSKRRLQLDILALYSGLRAVVMVDYGGKMPELQEHLCALLSVMRKESTILLPLRIMVIEDMIYMVHPKGLVEHALASLSLCTQLLFVDLEQDPPKLLLNTDQNVVVSELLEIQKSFSSIFSVDADSEISEVMDLSRVVKDTQISLPTLNGWLLGYPMVYLFSKERATEAAYNLSTKSLRIYQIVIRRNKKSGTKSSDELMSFTVPCDLSPRGEREPWAVELRTRLLEKFESCKPMWMEMKMEVNQCYPQAVVL